MLLREALRVLLGQGWPPWQPAFALQGAGLSPLGARLSQVAGAAAAAAANGPWSPARAAAATAELFGFGTLWMKTKKMRGVYGTLNPSLWRYYHRHGYWAQRRKMGVQHFGIKRSHKYHEVPGYGKQSRHYVKLFAQWWQDPSYYRPYKNYVRF
mmetsp:Transcript_55126/g.102077  ORF Transcript_55126/g.102077 Transcript_55126/m.102077 type:complete len:154 (+) Transcript_55126:72-533(+)